MSLHSTYLYFIFGLCFVFGCEQNKGKETNTTYANSMIAKPNYSSAKKLTGEERKFRTNEFLKAFEVPTLEHLPLVEDFNDARFRSDKEVAERCVILYGIIFVVHGEASGQEMIEYFKNLACGKNSHLTRRNS